MRRHRGRSHEQHFPFYSWPWHFIAKIGCGGVFGSRPAPTNKETDHA